MVFEDKDSVFFYSSEAAISKLSMLPPNNRNSDVSYQYPCKV